MISNYTNQAVTHKAKSSVNEYNETTYTSSSIKARFQYKRQLVRDKKGEQVISEAEIYTETAINVDDVITFDSRDWTIRNVLNMYDLDGSILYYKGVL
jgi:hypothetical protein